MAFLMNLAQSSGDIPSHQYSLMHCSCLWSHSLNLSCPIWIYAMSFHNANIPNKMIHLNWNRLFFWGNIISVQWLHVFHPMLLLTTNVLSLSLNINVLATMCKISKCFLLTDCFFAFPISNPLSAHLHCVLSLLQLLSRPPGSFHCPLCKGVANLGIQLLPMHGCHYIAIAMIASGCKKPINTIMLCMTLL